MNYPYAKKHEHLKKTAPVIEGDIREKFTI